MFCTTCGSLLHPKTTSYGKWMACPKGHVQPKLNTENKTLRVVNTTQGKKIEVLGDENPLAVYDHICKKCGHDKAELIERSCAYSDEDNINQMKCCKCKFIEQLEGKVK